MGTHPREKNHPGKNRRLSQVIMTQIYARRRWHKNIRCCHRERESCRTHMFLSDAHVRHPLLCTTGTLQVGRRNPARRCQVVHGCFLTLNVARARLIMRHVVLRSILYWFGLGRMLVQSGGSAGGIRTVEQTVQLLWRVGLLCFVHERVLGNVIVACLFSLP